MTDYTTKPYAIPLLITLCFLLGCMFIYWSVQYWVVNNFDQGRYEIVKIQSGGSDSWSFWKIDRRMGGVDYCNLVQSKDGGVPSFTCQRAKPVGEPGPAA